MVIIQVAGGLGNQLQQYALYRKFLELGREARLDTSWFSDTKGQERVMAKRVLELDYFDRLEYMVCTEAEKRQLIGRDGLAGKLRRKLLPDSVHRFQETQPYHAELLGFKDRYVSGYFACDYYYADILPLLRKEIRFPSGGSPANQAMAEKMQQTESVSIHVRRGDYLDPGNQELFGNICTEAYYAGAEAYITKRFPQARFYIFSDDSSYIKQHYQGGQYTIIDWNQGKNSFYDMWLMSKCRHNICANSTFSFWGARLNGYGHKIMIRPSLHKNTATCEPALLRELWQGWTFLDNTGEVQ